MTDNTEAAKDIGLALRETDKEHCEDKTGSKPADDGSNVCCAGSHQVSAMVKTTMTLTQKTNAMPNISTESEARSTDVKVQTRKKRSAAGTTLVTPPTKKVIREHPISQSPNIITTEQTDDSEDTGPNDSAALGEERTRKSIHRRQASYSPPLISQLPPAEPAKPLPLDWPDPPPPPSQDI